MRPAGRGSTLRRTWWCLPERPAPVTPIGAPPSSAQPSAEDFVARSAGGTATRCERRRFRAPATGECPIWPPVASARKRSAPGCRARRHGCPPPGWGRIWECPGYRPERPTPVAPSVRPVAAPRLRDENDQNRVGTSRPRSRPDRTPSRSSGRPTAGRGVRRRRQAATSERTDLSRRIRHTVPSRRARQIRGTGRTEKVPEIALVRRRQIEQQQEIRSIEGTVQRWGTAHHCTKAQVTAQQWWHDPPLRADYSTGPEFHPRTTSQFRRCEMTGLDQVRERSGTCASIGQRDGCASHQVAIPGHLHVPGNSAPQHRDGRRRTVFGRDAGPARFHRPVQQRFQRR